MKKLFLILTITSFSLFGASAQTENNNNGGTEYVMPDSFSELVKMNSDKRSKVIEYVPVSEVYEQTPSGELVARDETFLETSTIFLIISGSSLLLGLIVFNNRNKSQKYEHVSNEGKVKLDILSGIDKLVKEVCQSAPEGLEGLFIMATIKDRCDSLIKNKSVIAVQNNMSASSVENIIEECRVTAINYYLE